MSTPFDLIPTLDNLLFETAQSIDEFSDSFVPQTRSADERFGDFQANGVLPYAKRAGINPRELAQKLIDALPDSEDWTIELAAPDLLILPFHLVFFFAGSWSMVRQKPG